MWQHWADTVEKLQKQIATLSEIAAQKIENPPRVSRPKGGTPGV